MIDPICPKFEQAATLLGKKWVGLIIHQLLIGPKRFNELETEIKISGKMLSDRLKDLEQQGIVKRNVYNEIPVRIEYELTEKGKSLNPIMNELTTWAERWFE
ncbi:winged helix-turn-helix transcriptional regulator [Candidatus Xianfuyuplasma coldseepsis]|uniref:Helix-turn-helix transcriptional regulator n=1 Tax=Candidatus Xianfuyuplasma coldseepsis TaxID=2782163 RepID=A0A7L7KQR4_9MOLU|nr:helix-turn-helix domain-containing protein [Xianfuyuplasma coldseepsis]QMS84622.1 helix-turn-helix transcriptional regulator [Xianfuyuplasma coldseepsis]